MKRLFLDANVIVDLLTARPPFHSEALTLMQLIREAQLEAYASTITVATASYLMSSGVSDEEVKRRLRLMRSAVELSDVTAGMVDAALADAGFPDFEDGVQYYSAKSVDSDCIISRDATGFAVSKLPVFTPVEFVATYG